LLSKYCWLVKETIKKSSKKKQPKRPSQSGHVETDLSKMVPSSCRTWAIGSTFWPIFLVQKTLFSCSECLYLFLRNSYSLKWNKWYCIKNQVFIGTHYKLWRSFLTNNNNKTTQTQTNNMRNEHNKRRQPIFFASKYSVCNFSTFGTTCVNH
jgi:hypothetical protein